MTHTEILRRFCLLAELVNREQFKFAIPTDCFCNDRHTQDNIHFQFSDQVMEFIEEAVKQQLVKI